jgi:hypothetical protein
MSLPLQYDWLGISPARCPRRSRASTVFNAEPCGIACEARILQRNVFERAQAMPTLFAVFCTSDDEIKTTTISLSAGLSLAFNVEWFQLSCHVLPLENRPPNLGQKLRFDFAVDSGQ